jgi:3-hydroxyisobutyrate dehydrogenase
MAYGYIGVGNMGGAVARRILSAHPLTVYDRNANAVRRMAEAGAEVALSAADLARRCDVIFLCLPTPEHVRSVLFDEGGIAGAAAAGTLIIDQTSGEPSATRDMATRLQEKSIELVDAPLSGGLKGAEEGTVAMMVGGTDEQFTRIRPLLEAIGPNVFHAGPLGTGNAVKLANNMVSAAHRLISMEALALAVKSGVEPKRAMEIFMASSARNFFMERFLSPAIVNGDLHSGFSFALMHKDVRLACQLGIEQGVTLFSGNLVREYFQMCMNLRGREADVNTIALVVEQLSGVRIVAPDGTPGSMLDSTG